MRRQRAPVRAHAGRRTAVLVAATAALAALGGALFLASGTRLDFGAPDAQPLSYAELTGSVFLPLPKDPSRPPGVRELAVPSFPDATSVWGATGRDPRGRIWVGVSARSSGMSAHLLQYDPGADAWHDRGAVVEQLKIAGLLRPGEGQVKIHSKIVTGADGWLYFASSDEDGEDPGASRPPRWGGHLWRVHPDSHQWEHLLAVPEGLVAVSGVGRHVFALGYWGHVLYRHDTQTGASKRIVVGSTGGHVSRNFVADAAGHAYVPRLAPGADGTLAATLVEYDSELRELAATPLELYLGGGLSPADNHGIVGLAYLADGRLLFTTHRGQLYLIEPGGAAPSRVRALGWFHPGGEAYAPSLFALGGPLVAGVTSRKGRYEWVVFEVRTTTGIALPLETGGLQRLLLYGSISRDNAGRFYVGGWASTGAGGQRPVVLQIGAGS